MLETLTYVGIASAALASGGLVQAGRATILLAYMRRDVIVRRLVH